MMSVPTRAIVLLSGGLDSATAAAIARDQGFEVCALSFRYGQRHAVEIERAAKIASFFQVARHVVIDINLHQFGGSALTDRHLAVPKSDSADDIGSDIPITYVPARNTIFLSFALAWSEVLKANDIFIGVNSLDYSGYPDCRPEYIQAFEAMANLATKANVAGHRQTRIHTPLISWTKAEIIRKGLELGVDYSMTSSCYDPTDDGLACGHCDSCLLRLRGFEQNGIRDPIKYV